MPTKTVFVEPEKFMDVVNSDGALIPVYHTYKNDDCDNNAPHLYKFTFNHTQDENAVFDIRQLGTGDALLVKNQPPYIKSEMPEDQLKQLQQQWEAWYAAYGGREVTVKILIQNLWNEGHLKDIYDEMSQ